MRISGGALRSRPLVAPHGAATRPTSDRVREAIFSILVARGAVVNDGRVLDLYAGSGALAFEALSRGARCATLVERARPAVASIRANADALACAHQITIVARSVERAVADFDDRDVFDLVFVDPPYADVVTAARTLERAHFTGHLAPEGLILFEHAGRDEPPAIAGLTTVDARRYGDTAIVLFKAL